MMDFLYASDAQYACIFGNLPVNANFEYAGACISSCRGCAQCISSCRGCPRSERDLNSDIWSNL